MTTEQHLEDWYHAVVADSSAGVFDWEERLDSFPHVGSILCIAWGHKTRYLLHLISATISSWVSSMTDCMLLFTTSCFCALSSSLYVPKDNQTRFTFGVMAFIFSIHLLLLSVSPCFSLCLRRVSFFVTWAGCLLAGVAETIWSVWHGAHLSALVSYRGRRPVYWMFLMWTDWQQTACHVFRKTRVLC